jgi:hypothetical protein
MNKVLYEMKLAAKQAPRLYFAPFVGAVLEMKKEARALRRPCPSVANRPIEGENEEGTSTAA